MSLHLYAQFKLFLLKGIPAIVISFMLILAACNTNTTQQIPVEEEIKDEVSPSIPLNPLKADGLKEGFIYESASFPECHASTLVELSGGKLMAAWFGGTHEKNPDVTIWAAVYEDDNWGPMRELADGIQNDSLRYPCWNPVLFQHRNGTLYLFYKVGPNPRDWWGEMKYSLDDGETWSYAERIPKGNIGPVRAKPIELDNGDLLCPSSLEYIGGNWKVHMETYRPSTNFWGKIQVDPNTRFDAIQPTILRHSEKDLQILCRSRQNRIVEATSSDNGRTWSAFSASQLPNPSAGIDGLTLSYGQQVLVYNPTEDGPNDRAKLNLAYSVDGKNWNDILKLEDQLTGEFSYPAIIQTSDGLLHITYTWKRQRIKHMIVKVER